MFIPPWTSPVLDVHNATGAGPAAGQIICGGTARCRRGVAHFFPPRVHVSSSERELSVHLGPRNTCPTCWATLANCPE